MVFGLFANVGPYAVVLYCQVTPLRAISSLCFAMLIKLCHCLHHRHCSWFPEVCSCVDGSRLLPLSVVYLPGLKREAPFLLSVCQVMSLPYLTVSLFGALLCRILDHFYCSHKLCLTSSCNNNLRNCSLLFYTAFHNLYYYCLQYYYTPNQYCIEAVWQSR